MLVPGGVMAGVINHSTLVTRWLVDHPRLRVLHGARYSPHDNPVERIWALSSDDCGST
jgi:hypothetical protein